MLPHFNTNDKLHTIARIFGTLSVAYLSYKAFKNRVPSNTCKKENLNILIIGASRGIGLGLARTFLSFGDNVIIASSKQKSITNAYKILCNEFAIYSTDTQLLECKQCDVTNPKDLHQLFEFATATFHGNKIDIIINNFGIDSSPRDFVWNISDDDIDRIVSTNLTGIILSNKISIKHYIESSQTTPLHIFNQGGAGTNGRKTVRMLTYGATKGAFLNIMNTLNEELKTAKLNHKIFCHTVSPGMVWTNLLANKQCVDHNKQVLSDHDVKHYWIVNALTDTVDNSVKWLVPRLRGIATMNTPKGGYFPQYLTKTSAFIKIVRGALFGYNKERFVDRNGRAMQGIH